ncbi:MAG: hypothetical protein LUG21_03470 [Clostridiales bacterium]|nr:hypothetical protein [Clostridiales bacterium]
MKKKLLFIVMALISIGSLLIETKLFYNIALFCDQYNSSPQIVYGGNQYLILSWINLALMAVLCILCIFLSVAIIIKSKKSK